MAAWLLPAFPTADGEPATGPAPSQIVPALAQAER
jgi:hypothetical protein